MTETQNHYIGNISSDIPLSSLYQLKRLTTWSIGLQVLLWGFKKSRERDLDQVSSWKEENRVVLTATIWFCRSSSARRVLIASDDVQVLSFYIPSHQPRLDKAEYHQMNLLIRYRSSSFASGSGPSVIAVGDLNIRLLHNAILRSVTLDRVRVWLAFCSRTWTSGRQWRRGQKERLPVLAHWA